MINRIITFLLCLFYIFITTESVAQSSFDTTVTVTPVDADGVYCPGDLITLTTEVGDSYQWFYDFSDSNTGGTLVSMGKCQLEASINGNLK